VAFTIDNATFVVSVKRGRLRWRKKRRRRQQPIAAKRAYDMDACAHQKGIVVKGMRFFDEIDQAQLAASAGITFAVQHSSRWLRSRLGWLKRGRR
jgi:hypothetical protein